MTHEQAMRPRHKPDRNDPNPQCPGELVYASRYFADDVSWTVYVCQKCEARIATVEGSAHWWNHVLTPVAAS